MPLNKTQILITHLLYESCVSCDTKSNFRLQISKHFTVQPKIWLLIIIVPTASNIVDEDDDGNIYLCFFYLQRAEFQDNYKLQIQDLSSHDVPFYWPLTLFGGRKY